MVADPADADRPSRVEHLADVRRLVRVEVRRDDVEGVGAVERPDRATSTRLGRRR